MNQVLLVSDQPMPNFLPVINREIKPDSVTLVVSEKMRRRAEWLKSEIAKHQVAILPDIDIGNCVSEIETMQDIFLKWCADYPDVFAESILNITGGTKPMAIAAQEVFRMESHPVFYVDITTDSVTWIGGERNRVSLSNEPTLNQFLGLNGISIRSGEFQSIVNNEKWRHFYGEVASDPRKWGACVRALNRIAFWADQEGTRTFEVADEDLALPSWNEMSQMLHADELVNYSGNGYCEEFASADARRFCNGIWLEHYVFEVLKSFGFDRKRAMMNVKIQDTNGNVNELDAIVLNGNVCYVIEDKSRNMQKGNAADSAVYKLAQLSSQMGLKARGILISALGVRRSDRERARAYNVEVIDWLPDLKSGLARIFGREIMQ